MEETNFKYKSNVVYERLGSYANFSGIAENLSGALDREMIYVLQFSKRKTVASLSVEERDFI